MHSTTDCDFVRERFEIMWRFSPRRVSGKAWIIAIFLVGGIGELLFSYSDGWDRGGIEFGLLWIAVGVFRVFRLHRDAGGSSSPPTPGE